MNDVEYIPVSSDEPRDLERYAAVLAHTIHFERRRATRGSRGSGEGDDSTMELGNVDAFLDDVFVQPDGVS